MEVIAQIEQLDTHSLDQSQLSSQIVDILQSHFSDYCFNLYALDATKTWAVLLAGTYEHSQEMIERGHRLPVDTNPVVGKVIRTGQWLVTFQEPSKLYSSVVLEVFSELALPLITRQEAIGALTICNPVCDTCEPEEFESEEVSIFMAIAQCVAALLIGAPNQKS